MNSCSPAPAYTPTPDDEAINALASIASNDRGMHAQLQKQNLRAPTSSSSSSGGEPRTRGSATESVGTVSTSQQGLAVSAASRVNGLRLPVQGQGSAPFTQEASKVHEVRLRTHLQQLISVRPIVTRRQTGGVDEAPKSPNSAARRYSSAITFVSQR
jgi:hypothetical protein